MKPRGYGDVIEEWAVGPVAVFVKHSCVRRDMFDLRTPTALPASLKAALATQGSLRGTDALYVIDAARTQTITVAPSAGRIVIMPRLSLERHAQRRAAQEIAQLVADTLANGEQ